MTRPTGRTLMGVLLCAVTAAGCDGGGGDDGVVQARGALTAVQQRVLGFEAPTTDWSSSSGTLSQSTTVSQGTRALGVVPNGWTEIDSVAMSSLGAVKDVLSYDVRLPQAAAWGETRMVLVAPSLGLFWQELGTRALAGVPAGSYQRIQFPVPPAVKAALQGSYSDLRFKVVVNGPALSGPYLIDNIDVALPTSPDGGAGGAGGGSGTVVSFRVEVPVGLAPPMVGLHAGSSLLRVNDRAAPQGFVVNMGGQETNVGVEAAASSIWSVASVVLRDRATVTGNVRSAGTVTLLPGATVTGVVLGSQNLSQRTITQWSTTFPSVNQGDRVPAAGASLTLPPGAYGNVAMNSQASITLSAGTYWMESLRTEPGGTLRLDSSAGPVLVYVRTTLAHKGAMVSAAGARSNVLFGFAGTAAVSVEAPFVGTLVAPNAFVNVLWIQSPHVGAFFGAGVEFHQGARLIHEPFPWDVLTGGGSTPGPVVGEPIVIGRPPVPGFSFGAGLGLTVTPHDRAVLGGGADARAATGSQRVTGIIAGRYGLVGGDIRTGGLGRTTCVGSAVNNFNYDYVHEAIDYSSTLELAAAPACSACGGGGSLPSASAPADGRLMRGDLRRIHRPRMASVYSSFGHGVFSNYDDKLFIVPGTVPPGGGPPSPPRIRLHDIEADAVKTEWDEISPDDGDAAVDGVFHDVASHAGKAVELRDSDGGLTPDPLIARTVTLVMHSGERQVFELVNPDPANPSARAGRFTRFIDTDGNQLVVSYVHSAGSTNTPGFEADRLWQIDRVVDMYGIALTFSYGTTRVNGRWAVRQVMPANGSPIAYQYDTTGPGGGLVGQSLSLVAWSDETFSTFTRTLDSASQMVVVRYDDRAASEGGVRKSVYFTQGTYQAASGTVAQTANLVRQVLNGDNELVYANFEDPINPNTLYVYEGGGSLVRLSSATGAVHDAYAQARSFDAATQLPWQADFVEVERYQYGAGQTLERTTDTYGRSTRLARGGTTRAVTGAVFADGTQLTRQLNQFADPTVAIDRNGNRVELEYDARGHLTVERQAAGTTAVATFRTDYNLRGQPLHRTDANGNVSDLVYDARGFLTEIHEAADAADGLRPVSRVEYDAAGRVGAMVDASGRRKVHSYDSRNRLRQILYPDTSTEDFTYDGFLLASRKDRNGNLTTFAYDSTSRLVTKVEGAGGPEAITTRIAYLSGTNLKASETRAGDRTEFEYDARKRLTRTTHFVTASRRLTTEVIYDIVGRRFSERDAYGRRTLFVYDANDRPVRTIKELVPNAVGNVNLMTLARDASPNPGYTISDVSYDALGRIVARVDERGVRSELVYDILSRLVEERRAVGRPEQTLTRHEYDAQGNRRRTIHPRAFTEAGGFVTEYQYTARNLLFAETRAAGRPEASSTVTTYTPTGKRQTVTDGRGNARLFTYDDCCDRLTSIIDQAGFPFTQTYDRAGNVIAVADVLGHRVTSTYDRLNRKLSETNPSGETITFSYDDDLTDGAGVEATFPSLVAGLGLGTGANGRATVKTNARGEREVAVIDGVGRLLRYRDGNGNVSSRDQDVVEGGLFKLVERDALGNTTTSFEDGAHLVRRVVDARGNVSTDSFDAAGHRLAHRDPAGAGENCVYDGLGRRTSCTDTAGTSSTFAYDANGNLLSETNALGDVRQCSFDGRNNRIRCTNRTGGAATFRYDQNDNLVESVDAEGRSTTQEFDERNLLVRRTLPDGSVSQRSYDAAQRLATMLEPGGNQTTFVHDASGRVVARQYSDGQTDTMTYDAASRLLTAQSSRYGTTAAFTYDAGGRITRDAQTVAGVTRAASFEYDAADRTTAVVYPGGKRLVRDHDVLGRLTRLTFDGNVVTTRTYDVAARLSQETLRGGLVRALTYRADGLPSRDAWGAADDLRYTFDAQKRRTAESDVVTGAVNQSFAYDDEHRLVDWTRSDSRHEVFEVTREGDQSRVTRGSAVEVRTHGADHALRTINGSALSYDARGNLTRNTAGDVYQWSVEGRLHQATLAGGGAASYVYDATGRRLGKTAGGQTTVFVWGGDDMLAELVDGVLERSYVYGQNVDELVAIDKRFTGTGGGTRLYTTTRNLNNTVTGLVDAAGAVAERYRYTAYGSRTIHAPNGTARSTSTIGNPFGFTGRFHDAETGLMEFRARYYSPGLGRFISRDDAYRDGLNLYQAYFVPNGVDPSGHDFCGSVAGWAGLDDECRSVGRGISNFANALGKALKPLHLEAGFDAQVSGDVKLCDGIVESRGYIEVYAEATLYGADYFGARASHREEFHETITDKLPRPRICGKCGPCCGFVPVEARRYLAGAAPVFDSFDIGGVVRCDPSMNASLCNATLGVSCSVNMLPYIPVIGWLLDAYDKIPGRNATLTATMAGTVSMCREGVATFRLTQSDLHLQGNASGNVAVDLGPGDIVGVVDNLKNALF